MASIATPAETAPAVTPNDAPETDAETMARYGITVVSVPQYHYKQWHYARLSDAVAQAKRQALSPDR